METLSTEQTNDKMELTEDLKKPEAGAEKENSEKVEFKVVYNKKKYDVSFGLDDTIGALKVHLADIINVLIHLLKFTDHWLIVIPSRY